MSRCATFTGRLTWQSALLWLELHPEETGCSMYGAELEESTQPGQGSCFRLELSTLDQKAVPQIATA
jgi:hypothetical protein